MAISPGISCSASSISLRPNAASDRSATFHRGWSLTMVICLLFACRRLRRGIGRGPIPASVGAGPTGAGVAAVIRIASPWPLGGHRPSRPGYGTGPTAPYYPLGVARPRQVFDHDWGRWVASAWHCHGRSRPGSQAAGPGEPSGQRHAFTGRAFQREPRGRRSPLGRAPGPGALSVLVPVGIVAVDPMGSPGTTTSGGRTSRALPASPCGDRRGTWRSTPKTSRRWPSAGGTGWSSGAASAASGRFRRWRGAAMLGGDRSHGGDGGQVDGYLVVVSDANESMTNRRWCGAR